MTTQVQPYLPVQGVEYLMIPEVSQRGKNLFETQSYAQDNNLVVLTSSDINRVAKAVQSDKPGRDFTRYARDRTNLNDKDVADAYGQLHDGVWNQYRVRARDVLMWVPSQPTMHPRLVSDEAPDTEVVSILLRDYKVVDGDKLDIRGITPDPRIRVNWPTTDGRITPEIVQLFGVQDWNYAQKTQVWTNPNPRDYEGLRALIWGFGVRERPVLGSDWGPWGRISLGGSLLGRRPQTNQ